MVLGFKTHINGKPTHFVERILASQFTEITVFAPKLHSMRAGDRWKTGMKIHMATGVRTKAYFQFNLGFPGLQVVKGIQAIRIEPWDGVVCVSGRRLVLPEIATLARNDGFDSTKDFFEYFDKSFFGQIIHWTDLRY